MIYGSIVNVRQMPLGGAGSTAERPDYGIPGAIWINLDNPAAPVWQRYDGTAWIDIGSVDPTLPAWALAGNALAADDKVLGSTDNRPWRLIANAATVLNIYSNGNMATGADEGYKFSIIGLGRFRGNFRVDNAANGNLVELLPGGVGIAPKVRLLSAGSVELYIGWATGNVLAVATDAAMSNAALYPIRARALELIGGNGIAAVGSNQVPISAVANNGAGDAAYLRMANVGVEKWVLGVLAGDTFLHFRSGNGTMATATEVAAMSQGGRFVVGGNSSTLEASAVLQAQSTTHGFLPPRMTTTQRDAIVTPANGLVIYNTTTNKHQGYNGTWNDFY